ncbi:MAG TPA: HPr family phosphocarrier protein [Pelolinea sp.]|nr:HPr family phosphocarrier protein [Pelolinea sp.]
MVETQLTVRSEQGLHARPADLFVRTVNRYKSDVWVRNVSTGSEAVNAKSILRVLSLGVYNGHVIHVSAKGVDESFAVREITRLVNSNFNESEQPES